MCIYVVRCCYKVEEKFAYTRLCGSYRLKKHTHISSIKMPKLVDEKKKHHVNEQGYVYVIVEQKLYVIICSFVE